MPVAEREAETAERPAETAESPAEAAGSETEGRMQWRRTVRRTPLGPYSAQWGCNTSACSHPL